MRLPRSPLLIAFSLLASAATAPAECAWRWSAEAWSQVGVEFTKALALRSQVRRAGWFKLTSGSGLALICAERTRQTGRFQSSSAPRVLLSPQGEQRELQQRRTVVRNYAERLRAGSSPAPVSGSSARKGVGVRVPASAPNLIK